MSTPPEENPELDALRAEQQPTVAQASSTSPWPLLNENEPEQEENFVKPEQEANSNSTEKRSKQESSPKLAEKSDNAFTRDLKWIGNRIGNTRVGKFFKAIGTRMSEWNQARGLQKKAGKFCPNESVEMQEVVTKALSGINQNMKEIQKTRTTESFSETSDPTLFRGPSSLAEEPSVNNEQEHLKAKKPESQQSPTR